MFGCPPSEYAAGSPQRSSGSLERELEDPLRLVFERLWAWQRERRVRRHQARETDVRR
jgi:hypothetical protein